ncbi:hypothetical protein [Pontibacter sp. SGAir0037]|uniref:hypothetical protein n=1 Tax=Pontibacter sp. SGAir0037 TaxID=2571030 RepID=UPI0010CCB7FB|nr:hypothetical protein [Pontibacter sp. SGAir0037]QCR23067.1 hypothetical protein C1N53_12415 [Pontibacter sp. SGAir0037]
MAEEIKSDIQIAEEWLEWSISDWKKEQNRLRIGKTKTLLNSLRGNISGGEGIRVQVEVFYAWYGQMVDMGVGRGTRSGGQKDNSTMRRVLGKGAGHDRKAKRWYSKGKASMGFQTIRLATLLGEAKAKEAVRKIANSVDHKHVITIK